MVQAENLGFCAANNLGVAASSAPYVMLLNSDAVLLGDAGRILVRYLEEHRGVNCVGPRIVLPNGEPQHRLWPVALVARKPVVCLVQWFFFEDWERRYKLPLEKIMRAVSQRAGYRNFIVQTQTMRRYFEALMPSARIWTLGCGVGDDLFQPPGQDGDYVLFLGRLDVRQKGLDLMIDALEQIHKAGAVLPLKVVGEGPGREYLEREVTARGLGDCVTLLGRLEGARKRDVLQGCAFVVMPSRQETFGIGALEAMAASKPVVGFDIDHLNEILRPAWAVLAGAPDARRLAAAVVRLWRDPDARRALGERAFRAARRHRWDALARQQGDIYTEIVKAGTKGDATGGSRRFLSRGGDRA